MKKLTFSLICTVLTLTNGLAQKSRTVSLLDSNDIELASKIQQQNWSRGFNKTLQTIGNQSVASLPFVDFTHNSNPDKQKKNFILNATLQPIIKPEGKNWHIRNYVHSMQIIPALSLRLFQNDPQQNDVSTPIRTPDLILRFNYLFSHLKLWNDSLKHKLYFGLSAFHHSNGQDVKEFNPDGTINTYNGNFAEILAFEGVIGGVKYFNKPIANNSKIKKIRNIELATKSSILFWKLGFEFHPKQSTTFNLQKYSLYGRKRFNFQLGFLVNPKMRNIYFSNKSKSYVSTQPNFGNKELRRFVFNASYIADKTYNTGSRYDLIPISLGNISKRLNVDLTWFERISTTIDLSVFMRVGYYGSDPYNIYFQESIFQARAGFAFGNIL